MTNKSALRILAVGSCRIFRPLRHLHNSGEITLINDQHHWFTHTAAAARQYVQITDGSVVLPLHLRELVLETALDLPDNLAVAEEIDPDVVMIEVSTLKEHRIEGTELNAHKIYGAVKGIVEDYRPVVNGDTTGLVEGHPLKALEVKYTSQSKLLQDLSYVQSRFGVPVLTVNHLYSETSTGAPASDRVNLTEALIDVQEAIGMPMYDTGPLIREYGFSRALLDQNHYRQDFEPVVADRMLRALSALC